MSLAENFVPVSYIEKLSQKVTFDNKGSGERDDHNSGTLMGRKSSVISASNQGMGGRSEHTNLFLYRIEVACLNIIFGMLNCMQNGIEHSQFYNFFNMDRLGESVRHPGFDMTINYHEEFWRKFSESVVEIQWVLYKSLYRLVTAPGLYKDGLLHSKIFSDSCEYGYKNSSIDLIEPS